jgi:hypothetical protein
MVQRQLHVAYNLTQSGILASDPALDLTAALVAMLDAR